MNKTLKTVLPVFIAALMLIWSSCKKKDVNLGAPPTLTFKTDGDYVSTNTAVQAGDTVVIGVLATDNGNIDKLAKLIIRKTINLNPVETIKELTIPEEQKTSYSGDFKFVLQTTGTQVYTFIVTNVHGLKTEKTITFTVNP